VNDKAGENYKRTIGNSENIGQLDIANNMVHNKSYVHRKGKST
jgi:hypothetical protein